MRSAEDLNAYIENEVLPRAKIVKEETPLQVWAWRGWPVCAGAAGLWISLSMMAFKRPEANLTAMDIGLPFICLLGGIALTILWPRMVRRRQGPSRAEREKRELILPTITFLEPGLTYSEDARSLKDRVHRSCLVNLDDLTWKRFSVHDRFTGTIGDTPVEMGALRWVVSGKDTSTRYFALFCMAELKTSLAGTTVLAPDFVEGVAGGYATSLLEGLAGLMVNKAAVSPGLPPVVRFDHLMFEKSFRVYATDPQVAYRIFTPSLIEQLMDQKGLTAATKMRVSQLLTTPTLGMTWKVSLSGDRLFLLLPKPYEVFETQGEFRAANPATYTRYRDDLTFFMEVAEVFGRSLNRP